MTRSVNALKVITSLLQPGSAGIYWPLFCRSLSLLSLLDDLIFASTPLTSFLIPLTVMLWIVHALSDPIYPTQFCLILSHTIISYSILSCPTLPYLHHHTMPYFAVSSTVLSCPIILSNKYSSSTSLLILLFFTAEKSLYSLQWWKKNPPTNSENNFECDMDEKVLSFFSILSTFLMLESAVCADPQTLEPSWKVMRMVRTYVHMYTCTSVVLYLPNCN